MFCQIYEATGVKPQIFRFPGGSVSSYNVGIHQQLIAEMTRRGFVYFDWNVANGDAVCLAIEAAKVLAGKGISARVLDMHTIKPLDVEAVTAAINDIGKVITVEDHNIINGLGSAVCEVAAEMGKGLVKRVGIRDQFGQSAPYERLLAMNGVTVEDIVAIAESMNA